jgi:hypothetical protein
MEDQIDFNQSKPIKAKLRKAQIQDDSIMGVRPWKSLLDTYTRYLLSISLDEQQ